MKKKIFAIIMIVALLTVGLSAIPIMADPANGQLTHVKLTPENVALVTGTTQQFTAQVLDSNNQPVANVTYFWLVAEQILHYQINIIIFLELKLTQAGLEKKFYFQQKKKIKLARFQQ